MMHKQNYAACCKNNFCVQDNSQWKNVLGCKNYAKDTRNRICISGPSKGFVQNLKDKLVNRQNETLQLQSKPVKKKQKDYYCLMLRKINSLDKKLQNLEHLFISHLSHTPNEVFNSSDNEPLYDYMDFYESVRSLVSIANRLKEDILCKQCDNHMADRNSLHLNDRIQVLDSELQNLYTYLDELQNCTGKIKGAKQYFVQDFQNFPFRYSAHRGGPKVENRRFSDFKDYRKPNKNKRKNVKKYYKDSCYNPSTQYIECCYEANEDSPASCQCSRCNLDATVYTMSPGRRRYSPKRFEHCQGRSIAKNVDCSCELCVNERKDKFMFRKNNLWVSQSISSCSCEICVNNNHKFNRSCSQKCNSARIKIIKPVRKGQKEENFLSEFQISYHEMEPGESDKRKKQKNRRRKLNINENYQNTDLETGDGSKGPGSTNGYTSNVKSGDSIIIEQTEEKFTKSKSNKSKTISAATNLETELQNVVYYELSPELNIITKGKNNVHVFRGSTQEPYQGRSRNAKENRNNVSNTREEFPRNGTYRSPTVNFDLRENNPSNNYSKKNVKIKRNSRDYPISEELFLEKSSDKKFPPEQRNANKVNGSGGKHLHITFCEKKEFEEGMKVNKNVKRKPERQYKYTSKPSPNHHRRHGGFCHFQNGKYEKEMYANKRYLSPYHVVISESDSSFETLEETESDSESCSSQYKVFFCDDPNCVEKLDSDELIMLMNKSDLNYCGENPYDLTITENVNDLKSDICEKCTVKEKTISVTPRKTKNRSNREKAKIIFKKEIIKCSNCRNKKSNQLSETAKTNREYAGSDTENNNRKKLGGVKNKTSSSNKTEKQVRSLYQGEIRDDSGSNIESKNIKENKNQISNQLSREKASSPTGSYNRKEMNKSRDNGNETLIVAHSNLDQSTSFKMSKSNNQSSNQCDKTVDLPGFGNLININIERGSYSVNKQSGVISPKVQRNPKDFGGAISLPKSNNSSGNKNITTNPIADTKDNKTENQIDHLPSGSFPASNAHSSNLNNTTANTSRNKPNQLNICSRNNKSISALDLAKSSEKEITIAKSESFITPVVDNKTKIQEGIHHSKDSLQHAVAVKSGIGDDKNVNKLETKKNQMSAKKETSLYYTTKENPETVLPGPQDSNYIYENRYGLFSNTKSPLNKNVVKPKVSTSRVKRSRLKFNKKFRPSLSKVSSTNSLMCQQTKLCSSDDFPSKMSYIFNPGRRISKLSKRRHNLKPRMYVTKEHSLSGIIKPQVKIVVHESYQNDLKIPSSELSNSRHKVTSISNYFSSSLVSESSCSTVNWEKVAKKLKEENQYNIA